MGQPRPFSLVAQRVKHLPAKQETQVQSLGQEDLLEKEMATHSSTLAWKIPWMEEPGGLQSMGSQRVPYRRNPRRNMLRHILIKLTKTKHKERILKAARKEATSNIHRKPHMLNN